MTCHGQGIAATAATDATDTVVTEWLLRAGLQLNLAISRSFPHSTTPYWHDEKAPEEMDSNTPNVHVAVEGGRKEVMSSCNPARR